MHDTIQRVPCDDKGTEPRVDSALWKGEGSQACEVYAEYFKK